MALLWAEREPESARRSLRQSLYFLRNAIGSGFILAHGDEQVGVETSAIWCDVVEFNRAVLEQRFEDAALLYTGEFLPGFHVDQAPAFSDWLERERNSLRQRALQAALQASRILERGRDYARAIDFARRAVDFAHAEEAPAYHLIRLLSAAGDRSAALHVYQTERERLKREYEVEPSTETTALVEQIRIAHSPAMSAPTAIGTDADGARLPVVSSLPPIAAQVRSTDIPSTAARFGSRLRLARRPLLLIPGIVLMIAIVVWMRLRDSRLEWVYAVALPEAARLVDLGRHAPAFALLRAAEEIAPHDPMLYELMMEASFVASINTVPQGVDVHVRDYHEPNGWVRLGRTPLVDVRLPAATLVWRLSREGYSTTHEVTAVRRQQLNFQLHPANELSVSMVRVRGGPFRLLTMPAVELDDYWIDRHEVTNEEYRRYMDQGAYMTQEYWNGILEHGLPATSLQALRDTWRDRTGAVGPATWEAGLYPDEEARYPVTGISWYEAANYCAARGKSLPSIYHWYRAARLGVMQEIARFSNFSGTSIREVAAPTSLGPNGAYDMAGNAKEWIANPAGGGRYFVLGGAWDEPIYQSSEPDAELSLERRSNIGFRCTAHSAPVPAHLVEYVDLLPRSEGQHVAVTDEVRNAYLTLYGYADLPLDARIESIDERAQHWTIERVSFTAGYGDERVPAVLFLPRRLPPPYQTVIYFPGGGSFAGRFPFGRGAEGQREWFLSLVRNGRAVVVPMYKGTYERHIRGLTNPPIPAIWRDFVIYAAKDLARTIDYLETRPDIDNERIAYYGLSAGASLGPIFLAVEQRISTAVLAGGGLVPFATLPEVEAVNFLPLVRTPTLMLNGRRDYFYPYETAQRPMFELLGTAPTDKKHVTYESGHMPHEWNQWVAEMLAWLDARMGPVSQPAH